MPSSMFPLCLINWRKNYTELHFRGASTTIGVMRPKPFYTGNQNEILVVLTKHIMGHWDSNHPFAKCKIIYSEWYFRFRLPPL